MCFVNGASSSSLQAVEILRVFVRAYSCMCLILAATLSGGAARILGTSVRRALLMRTVSHALSLQTYTNEAIAQIDACGLFCTS